MISLQSELTTEDFFQFSYFTGWSAASNKKKRILYYTKFFLYCIVFLALIFLFRKEKLTWPIVIVCSVMLLLFSLLMLPPWIKSSFRKQVDAMYSDPKNFGFFLKTEIIMDEKGIHSKDDISSTTFSWSAIVEKAETQKYFYLYINTILAIVIPKTSFKSLAEQEEFKKLLLIHVPLGVELDKLTK